MQSIQMKSSVAVMKDLISTLPNSYLTQGEVAAPLTLVLAVGSESSASMAQRDALKSAGYIVVSSASITEAFRYFQDGDFDLVVLYPSISVEDGLQLISLIRARRSLTPIACVANTSGLCDTVLGQASTSFWGLVVDTAVST